MSAVYRYHNHTTGETVQFAQPMPVFATHPSWALVDGAPAPEVEGSPRGADAKRPDAIAGGKDSPAREDDAKRPGELADQKDASPADAGEVDLSKLGRAELNAVAVGAGVESPEALGNKAAVIDAIIAASAAGA